MGLALPLSFYFRLFNTDLIQLTVYKIGSVVGNDHPTNCPTLQLYSV